MDQKNTPEATADSSDWQDGLRIEQLAARRKKLLVLFAMVVGAAAIGAGTWWYLVASRYVSTENAYVEVSSAQVTPLTSGRIMEVRVHDAELVQKGDLLAVVDPEDAKINVAQLDAAYALTLRKARTYFTTVDARRADFEKAKAEYERRERVKSTGAVTPEELAAMKATFENAKAAYEAAEAFTQGTTVEEHPEVLAARAQLNAARLALRRTLITSPVSGIVAQRSVQVGQMVTAGRSIMTVVPINDVYVNANFKEDQLTKVRPGQPVILYSDLYGNSVEFHGRVVGLGGGTGSAFAVIPAQNATGNWIKVIQRVPVRIALDAAELREHPLRVGLSMRAKIKIAD